MERSSLDFVKQIQDYGCVEDFLPTPDPEWIQKEREKARKLRSTAWWKRKLASGICHYCRGRFRPKELTMDHKIPLSRGGASLRENMVACCKECNNQKSYLLPAEWVGYLERLNSEFDARLKDGGQT